MPPKSKAQQRAAGADVARCEEGKKPRNFPTCELAHEFARAPAGVGDLPTRSLRPHGSGVFTAAEIAQGYKKLPAT